jgi:hypothetical protein
MSVSSKELTNFFHVIDVKLTRFNGSSKKYNHHLESKHPLLRVSMLRELFSAI